LVLIKAIIGRDVIIMPITMRFHRKVQELYSRITMPVMIQYAQKPRRRTENNFPKEFIFDLTSILWLPPLISISPYITG
jgi:hypothetical protein